MNIDPDAPRRTMDVYAVALRLLGLRTEKGWAASYLADLAGVPEAVVRRAEKGSFSLINLKRINDALGASLDWTCWGDER